MNLDTKRAVGTAGAFLVALNLAIASLPQIARISVAIAWLAACILTTLLTICKPAQDPARTAFGSIGSWVAASLAATLLGALISITAIMPGAALVRAFEFKSSGQIGAIVIVNFVAITAILAPIAAGIFFGKHYGTVAGLLSWLVLTVGAAYLFATPRLLLDCYAKHEIYADVPCD